ncbi:MAG: chromosome segregation protein SMC [Faecalibacterium prausnitzii]
MQAQQLTIAVERLNGDIRSITEDSGSDSRIAVLENDIAATRRALPHCGDIAAGSRTAPRRRRAGTPPRRGPVDGAQGRSWPQSWPSWTRLLRLTSENNASGARRDILRAEVADLTAKRTEAQVAKAAAEAAAQAAQEQLPALAENTEALQAQRDEAKQDLADTIEYRKMLAENEKQLANVKAGVELKLKGRRTALNEADAAEQKLGRELDAARQRLGVLKELEKNMDGYQNSVKTVMRAASARRLRGIIGPVSSILSVEPGREVAIETALGGALQNIVAENEAAAKAGIALLRSENAGRATFLPLDTVQPGFFRGSLSGSARLASSLVKADPRYANIVSNLLGRIVVVDDINEASRVARELGYHNKVVTLDGQVINAGGSFTGGSVQRSAGLFTRKQEMEELRSGRQAPEGLPRGTGAHRKLKTQTDALAAELTATESEIITAANDRIRAEAEQKRLEAAVEQSEAALAGRQDEMERRKAQLDAARARAEDAAKQEEALAADIETRTAELERIAEGDDAFLAQQRSLAERLSAKRMEQLARQKDAELARSQIEALVKQARDAESRRAALEESLTALAARSGACQEEIEAIRRAKTDSTALIAAKEAEIREATEKRLLCQKDETEALAKGRAAADEREEMGREMARLAERKAAAEGEYDQMAAKLWDEYQLTLSQAEELCVEFENVNVLRAQVADLRGRIRALGNVNVSAIEEYQEVKARYDTLRAQVEDVEGSRNELTRMITSLSGQMKDIFTDSFRAINENFGRSSPSCSAAARPAFPRGRERCARLRHRHPRPAGQGHQESGGAVRRRQALVAISIYSPSLPSTLRPSASSMRSKPRWTTPTSSALPVSPPGERQDPVHRHHPPPRHMEAANVLYGVTMQEDGVSKLLKLDLNRLTRRWFRRYNK